MSTFLILNLVFGIPTAVALGYLVIADLRERKEIKRRIREGRSSIERRSREIEDEHSRRGRPQPLD